MNGSILSGRLLLTILTCTFSRTMRFFCLTWHLQLRSYVGICLTINSPNSPWLGLQNLTINQNPKPKFWRYHDLNPHSERLECIISLLFMFVFLDKYSKKGLFQGIFKEDFIKISFSIRHQLELTQYFISFTAFWQNLALFRTHLCCKQCITSCATHYIGILSVTPLDTDFIPLVN